MTRMVPVPGTSRGPLQSAPGLHRSVRGVRGVKPVRAAVIRAIRVIRDDRSCSALSGDSHARRDDRLDPAADVEVAHDLHARRLAGTGEVVEDPVHRALVEDPVVAEAPEIELEA